MGRLGRLPLLNEGATAAPRRGLGRSVRGNGEGRAETGPRFRPIGGGEGGERTNEERWSYLVLPRPEFVSEAAAAALSWGPIQ